MITNYEKFLEQIHYLEPNLKINESIIRSWSTTMVLRHIRNKLITFKNENDWKLTTDNKDGNILLEINNLSKNSFDILVSILNYCNWFISELNINNIPILIKNNNSPTYKWKIEYKDESNNTIPLPELMENVFICIEKVHDDSIKTKFKYLYHACNIKDLESIRKIGLQPQNRNKWLYHPSRLYFCDNLDMAKFIGIGLKKMDSTNSTFTILKIDLKNKNIKLYRDPNFEKGMYTYSKIEPNRIEETGIMF